MKGLDRSSMSEQEDTQEQSRFDVALERTKKALSRNPAISASDLFTRFIEPLFGELRNEYSSQLEDIEEAISTLELPEEDVVEQAKQLVLMLGNLIDNTFVRIGWINEQGMTDKMPIDLKNAFQQATTETRMFFERLAEIEAEDSDEDDDADDDDDADEEDSSDDEGDDEVQA